MTGSSQIGEIFPISVRSGIPEDISPLINSNAIPASAATSDASLFGIEYISGNLPSQVKSVKPITDKLTSNLNPAKINVPSRSGLAVAIPVADQLMVNLNSVKDNLQSAPSNSDTPIADLSQINLQFANRNMPVAKSNHMGALLKQNSLMSIRNNFDVKLEPFVAVDTIKSKIQNPPSAVQQNIPDMLGSRDITKEQVPYNITLDNSQRPLTRFAAPQLVYTPAPPVIVKTTSPTPKLIPVINTTPKIPATTTTSNTKTTQSQPLNVQFHEKSPTPSETANMIIQSFIANKDLTNGILPDASLVNAVNPGAFSTKSPSVEIIPTKGVGINVPGHTVAETLAFLKQEMKPARTVEEHMNPIYQMFDASGSAQNNRGTKVTLQPTRTTLSPRESYLRAEMTALKGR